MERPAPAFRLDRFAAERQNDRVMTSAGMLIVVLAAALGALLGCLARGIGIRRTFAWIGAVLAYGAARRILITWMVRAGLLAAAPYEMRVGLMDGGLISGFELLGWLLAVSFAWLASAEAAVRVRGLRCRHRRAVLAAGVLACLAWSVESAGIAAGWWTWRLAPGGFGFSPVPWIALVDWGFVAFDIVYPFWIWTTPSSRWERYRALLLFPLHFGAHAAPGPWFAAIPVSLLDVVHAGTPLAFWVHPWRTSCAYDRVPPGRCVFGDRVVLGVSALILVSTASIVAIEKTPAAVPPAVAPWAVLTVTWAFVRYGRWKRGTRGVQRRRPVGSVWVRIAAAGAGLLMVVVLRAPYHRRNFKYAASLREAALQMREGRFPAAGVAARRARSLRPDRSEGYVLEALAALKQGRRSTARAALISALKTPFPGADALLLSAETAMEEGRFGAASHHLEEALREAPGRLDLRYLYAWASYRRTGDWRRFREAMDALWREIDRRPRVSRAGLCRLAARAGDRMTLERCRRAGAFSP